MTKVHIWKVVFISFLSLVLSIPAFSAQENIKKEEVKKFLMSAADYIKMHGKDAAIKEFNDRHGLFTKGSDYIFVIDYQGTMLANVSRLDLVGKNVLSLKDANGKYLNQLLIKKAKMGGGWVSYLWVNPMTNKVQCKLSYVIPMGSSYFIGSGYYKNRC